MDYEEIQWSILQHYRVCKTPLLDITSSLKNAISFALQKSNTGYLYVLALPETHGSITYSVAEQMFIINLSKIVCPPIALRPHFQKAYVVGDLPRAKRKLAAYDFGRRIIAKFKIEGEIKNFNKVDNDLLFPDNEDDFYEICNTIMKRLPPDYQGETKGLPWSDD